MAFQLPKLLGEVHDKDTQFTAFAKDNQDIILIFGAILIFVAGYFIYDGFFNKRAGTWRYALCHAFLEQYAQYPTDIKITTVSEKQNSAKMTYLVTNSYGDRSAEEIECFYTTANNRIKMNRVSIDRKTLVLKNPDLSAKQNKKPITSQDVLSLWTKQHQSMVAMKYPGITLEGFNKVIPVILASEDMDLTIPNILPKSLEDLKF